MLVFVLGAGLTLFLAWGLHGQIREAAQIRFDNVAGRLELAVHERLDQAMEGLRDVRSASVLMGRPLNRAELRAWVGSRVLSRELPGVRALSLIRPLELAALPAYEAQVRREGWGGFKVRTGGSAQPLFVIDAIEPLAENRKALGFDVGSEPTRREAIMRAVDSGEPTLTARITLVQDGLQRAGLLYFMPIYKPGVPLSNVAQRRSALVALISAPIVAQALLDGLEPSLRSPMVFSLEDPSEAPGTKVLAQSGEPGEALPPNASSAFSTVRTLDVGGRRLQLRMQSTSGFDVGQGHAMVAWLALLGIALSATAAMAVWLMNTGRLRAQKLAARMTADLVGATQVAEKASRESAALISTLDQFSMVCITAPDGSLIEVNDALCRASGYSRAELLGRNPRMLGSGEHDALFWVAVWQTLLHGQPWSGQLCNRNKQGESYWVQCVISPVLGAGGEVDKYISIAYDITDTRRAQDELKAHAERYNLAIDGGSDGMWDWMNVHAHDEWWSPQFFRLLGYEPNEIPANLVTFDAMLHPDDQKATFAAIERAFMAHEPFDVEYRLRTKSGAYRWFRSRAKVYFDDFGAATRMAGSIQDVHERKEAQAKLRESSQQMAAILSLSPDAFVSFDMAGLVSYISPAWTHLTGLSGPSLLGADEASFSAQLFSRAVPGQAVAGLEALRQLGCKDGADTDDAGRVVVEMMPPARRMLEMRLRCSQGGAVSQVLHIRDVTHETEVDQMKSAFLSMAAHELRTPMASIYGFTELLLTREIKPDKQKDLLGRIYRQSEAMASIINELLDLARIEARQGKDFSFGACDVADLLGAVIRDFKLPLDRAAPLTAWPQEPIIVWADRQKLQQALLNVLSNAYKYSPQGGDVQVRVVQAVWQGKPQVGIEIEDHGIGLSPEQLARVGERFYRADKSGSIPGTGLGVAIVKEIMGLMGGSLALRSEPGQGTTVTLWLPRMDDHNRAASLAA